MTLWEVCAWFVKSKIFNLDAVCSVVLCHWFPQYIKHKMFLISPCPFAKCESLSLFAKRKFLTFATFAKTFCFGSISNQDCFKKRILKWKSVTCERKFENAKGKIHHSAIFEEERFRLGREKCMYVRGAHKLALLAIFNWR